MDKNNSSLMASAEHIQALEQFPLNRSLNSFRWHGNPILEKGAPGEWDESLIRDPMVFYDYDAPEDEKFKIYYSGQGSDGKMQIGLAYGSSLENLKKYSGNPIVKMTEDWENIPANHNPNNHNPYVIRLPGAAKSYEMVYTAYTSEISGQNNYFVSSIVRVASTDGKNWRNKKQVFEKFKLGQNSYSPQKPILHYNVEENRHYLVFAASSMRENKQKNEGFTGLATSVDGENYSFEKVIIPQDIAGSIYDPHGLVSVFGWYFLLVTHDSGQAYDFNGNSNWPERWMVSKDMKNWYGSPKSVWDTYPDEGYLYSHLSPLVTESGWAYFVYDYYDYGEPNRFCLAKIPYIGKSYNVIVDKPILKHKESTKLSDCYPAIRLELKETFALTCECTYHKKASYPAKIHLYTSYNGKNWDTEEQKNNSGKPIFGTIPFSAGKTVRHTKDISTGARFIKITVENEDPNQAISNVKIIATFG